jgi:ubiquinone/menaquinone biosynthesis C-methylase UbiE
MTEFTRSYEQKTLRSYSEFKETKRHLANWGIGSYKNRYIEYYTNEDFIEDFFTKPIRKYSNGDCRIVDFGGGDGVLLNTILGQLADITTIRIIEAINIDCTKKSLDLMRRKYGERINALNEDVLDCSLKDNTVDIALSRHVLNYFGLNDQKKYFASIYHKMKEGALAIIMWPGGKNLKVAKSYSKFYSKIAAVITGETPTNVLENKYFSSVAEVATIAETLGFKIVKAGNTGLKFRYTALGFDQRFSLNPDQTSRIKKIFDRHKVENGIAYYEAQLNFIICVK